jgi:hypothetical protein
VNMTLTTEEQQAVLEARAKRISLMPVTSNERRQLELGRVIKNGTGHGTMLVEYRDRLEVVFHPTARELPPERPAARPRC